MRLIPKPTNLAVCFVLLICALFVIALDAGAPSVTASPLMAHAD